LLCCEGADGGGRCVTRWDVVTGEKAIVADKFHDKRLNSPNDLCVDRVGRVYFTDPRYAGDEPRELQQQAVYRVERDGSVVEVTHDVEMPNGIVLSPDEKILYVGDHNNGGNQRSPNDPPPQRGAMKLYAFPLNEEGLVAGPARTLADFGKENGCDGIAVDAKGNLYVTCRSLARPGIMVLDPHGTQLAFLPTGPAGQQGGFEEWQGIPSNVEFSAPNEMIADSYLYVTIDKGLYRIPIMQRGPQPVWAVHEKQ